MNIILLGPPGAGKGTMSEYIKKDFKLVHLSTGDLLRREIKAGTDNGKLAKQLIDNGKLVPDDLIIGMLRNRLERADVRRQGALLDGFPRTIPQAEALKEICDIDKVIYLKIAREILINRILSRRICEKCGEVYSTHTFNGNKCEKCSGNLIVRDDDNEDTVKERINTYKELTLPLVDYYRKQGMLDEIDATMTIPEEVAAIENILSKIK